MTASSAAVDHPSRRLIIALPRDYDDAIELYERLAPVIDEERFAKAGTWQDVLELAQINAPHGFMRYYRGNITPAMAPSGTTWKATAYLMGNTTIAQRMYRHDPSVMLHAPLRTLLYVDSDGATRFAVDQPSLLFASYGSREIAEVGVELDGLLANLITLMDGDVPAELTHHAT